MGRSGLEVHAWECVVCKGLPETFPGAGLSQGRSHAAGQALASPSASRSRRRGAVPWSFIVFP